MLRLAEQCDTIAWHISLAEQNWRIWPPLRGYYFGRTGLSFGRTGLSFGRKKLLAPPKKCPKNAYEWILHPRVPRSLEYAGRHELHIFTSQNIIRSSAEININNISLVNEWSHSTPGIMKFILASVGSRARAVRLTKWSTQQGGDNKHRKLANNDFSGDIKKFISAGRLGRGRGPGARGVRAPHSPQSGPIFLCFLSYFDNPSASKFRKLIAG